MSIKRNRSKKKSWLSRFWDWLWNNAGDEDPEEIPDAACPPSEMIPPRAAGQASLYRMLDARPGQSQAKTGGLQVYNYCGVVFYKADIVYHYLNPGMDIRVGDRVLVPVHIHGGAAMAEGLVVSSGEYLAQCVPYPVSQASMIVKKL